MKNDNLSTALIPEKDWDNCFVDDDGNIYTPRYDHNGELLETGQQLYSRLRGN